MNVINKTLLLVEDEKNLAFSLILNLEAEGWSVVHIDNGRTAVDYVKNHLQDLSLVILDIMLPEVNGLEIAKVIRQLDGRIPLIMLTAKASDNDKIHGLKTGADDYLTKPFHLEELLLKVERAAKRDRMMTLGQSDRSSYLDFENIPSNIRLNDWLLDVLNHKFKVNEKTSFGLTSLETKLLSYFLLNPDRVISREELLRAAWNLSGQQSTRTVDNFIVRLRKIFDEIEVKPNPILSIRGRGYILKAGNSAESI